MSVETILTYNVSYINCTFDNPPLKEDGVLRFNSKNRKVYLYDQFGVNQLNCGLIVKNFNVGDEFTIEQFKIYVESERESHNEKLKRNHSEINEECELKKYESKRKKSNDKINRVPIYSKNDLSSKENLISNNSPRKVKISKTSSTSPLKKLIENINASNYCQLEKPVSSISHIISNIRNNKDTPNNNKFPSKFDKTRTLSKEKSIFEKCCSISKRKDLEPSYISNTSSFRNESIHSLKNPYELLINWNLNHIVFPNPETIAKFHQHKHNIRTTLIPNRTDSLIDYKLACGKAIIEDINFQMLSIAKAYHSFFKKNKKSIIDMNFQKQFRTKTSLPVYFNCELLVTSFPTSHHRNQTLPNRCPQYFLKLDDESKEHYSQYSKDDIWIVSSSPSFIPKSKDDIFIIATSMYHGLSQTGILEVKPLEPLSFTSSNYVYYPLNQRDLPVHCIRGPNISNELSMLYNLEYINYENLPILKHLLSGETKIDEENALPLFGVGLNKNCLDNHLKYLNTRFKLNEYQLNVLKQCSKWFDNEISHLISPVTLVHGVFGSGKSHMLVILIIFICEILDIIDPDKRIRILVSSATNVAVDRILLGLLENDFTNFVRVGSLKRISKDILPYSIHREKKDGSYFENERFDRNALKDLTELLNDGNLTKDDRRLLLEQIEFIKNGDIEKRISLLNEVRVIGATCASTAFPVLEGNTFQIVILDECSQMTEPMSLLPIGKFGCRSLVLVGDPMQLPPTLSTFFNEESNEGLGKTLFKRMVNIGNKPIMLKTQYRLHPTLSSYVNRLFYNNQLKDGVTIEERKPLLKNLPPLMFCDASSGEERCNTKGSFENYFESLAVINILDIFLSNNIQGYQIGIICLYKAQEEKVKDMLKNKSEQVMKYDGMDSCEEDLEYEIDSKYEGIQISTVDAFQGAEKDIIIVSCSRTTSRGFMDSPFRTNVALTRAKHHLIIVGSSEILKQSKLWREVLLESKRIYNGYQSAERIIIEKSLLPKMNKP